MEMPKSLEEIRKDIQSVNKEIDMLEKLIERAKSQGKGDSRQCELFEKSLKEKKESLAAFEIKEKKIVDSINDAKERGIISDTEQKEIGGY